MRNLKRALSLALASVMLLGMMVVGTSAASYPDVDENDNVEAIEVLNAVNVMIGRQGNFEPDEAVNRHEMAVIMAKLVLGVDTADNYVGSHPFTDVVPWADKYVAACYENGLTIGTSATTYGGGNPLTAVQAAAMMLRALGYKDLSVGATDWRAPVTAMANQIRLFNGVASNPNEKLNRNQVAQLALNTLKSPMVNLVDNTISWSNGDGQIIMTGGSREYIVLSSREAYARAINRVESAGTSASQIGGWTVELGEHLYNGKLQLNDVTDDFKRPAREWEYDGKEIGTYIKDELLKFENVGEVTGKDLYDLLGKTVIDEYALSVALDGVTVPETVRNARIRNGFDGYDGDTKLGSKHNQEFVFDAADMNRNNKGSVGATGTGVLTQVFVDPTYDNGSGRLDGKVWIAVINTYLARAKQDYDTRREELLLDAYSVDKYNDEYVALPKSGLSEQIRLGVEDYPIVKDASEKDAFLVTFAEGEVQTIVPAEVMDAVTISSFKSKDNLVVDGTQYKFTATAGFDADALKVYTGGNVTNLKDTTYNVFLDAYGNTIGVQEVDAKKNYVFLAAIDINDSNLVNGIANAKAVFLDGTVDTIRVNLDKSTLDWYKDGAQPGGYNKNSILNTWCTYTVNNSSVYTVKQVVDVTAGGDVPSVSGAVTTNDTGLAQYHQTGFANDYKIDKKHITLQGKAGTGNFARVYGNEDTVYLNAELGNLTNENGTWGVIKDVDTVTVAAENVNLTVWTNVEAVREAQNSSSPSVALKGSTLDNPTDTDYATKGVYTLYDDDGIVIAAVVVGEDDGSARNLVYVHSGSIESESYNGSSATRAVGDGMWTWTRKVIQNGEEVTLTEVSDGNSDLDKMQQYHWYQIKTNADGEVTGVYRLDQDDRTTGDWATTAKHRSLPAANLDRYDDYALSYLPYTDDKGVTLGEIAYTVQNGASTVLYWNENLINSRLRMDGRTLYVATNDQTGFIVNSNVKWVVQQWDNNKKETYIDDGTTAAGLKNMIDEVNRRYTNNENYTYQVSAVIESGIASSVVIYFNENDYNRPDTGISTGKAKIELDAGGRTWTLTIYTNKTLAQLTDDDIYDAFIDAGCTNVIKTRDGWTFTRNGRTYADQDVTIKVDNSGITTYTITKGAETNGTFTVSATSATAGTEITVTATPAANYEVDTVTVTGTTVSGTGNTRTFVMPAQNVTVNVTFKASDPVDGYNVDTKGTAVKDNHYSTDLPASGKVAKGESFTITALKTLGIVVYDETGRHVVRKSDEPYTVTPTGDITVFINRITLGPVGETGMGEVEDKTPDTPAGIAVMAMFARAARAADDYQKMIITDVKGKNHEYIVKVVTGTDGLRTYYFPSAESVQEAIDILDAVDLAGGEFDPDFDTATDEEIEENWGSENPVTAEITGDAKPYTIKLSWTGEVTDQNKIDAINDALAELGIEEKVTLIDAGAAWASKTDTTPVGNIESTVDCYIYVNDEQLKDDEGNAIVVNKKTEGDVVIPSEYLDGVYYLVNEANWNDGYEVVGNKFPTVTLENATLIELTKDLKLVTAYKMDSVADTIATVDGEGLEEPAAQSGIGASPLYIPTDASVTFTAQNVQNATHSKLTIGGETVETKPVAAEDAEPAEYTVDMSKLKPEMVTDGVIGEVAEAPAYNYTIKVCGVEIPWTNELAKSMEVNYYPALSAVKAGTYLVKGDIPNGKFVATDGLEKVTVTIAEDTKKITITKTSAPEADENSVVELVAVTEVTLANETYEENNGDVLVIGGEKPAFAADATYYMVPGTQVDFDCAKGTTIKVEALVDGAEEPTNVTAGWKVSEKDTTLTMLKVVTEVTVTVAELASDVTADTAKTAVAAFVTEDEAFTAAATTEGTVSAGAKGLTFTITLTAADGYCFDKDLEIGDYELTFDVSEGGAPTVAFEVSVNIAAAAQGGD